VHVSGPVGLAHHAAVGGLRALRGVYGFVLGPGPVPGLLNAVAAAEFGAGVRVQLASVRVQGERAG
jgi:hypothetical protein